VSVLNKKIINKFEQVSGLEVKTAISLKKYTTFKVGGPADLFVVPHHRAALQEALAAVKDHPSPLPHLILGRGSNIIFSDKGFRGLIIHTGQLDHYQVRGQTITAGAGISLSRLADIAAENNLGGLEFASGIPGSLGGAVYMNAGAYGREIKDVLIRASIMNSSGEMKKYSSQELAFSYRHSLLQEKNIMLIEAEFGLDSRPASAVKSRMKKINRQRKKKQPLEYPSAGSIFKRPENDYAGRLIEEAGLKGTRIGGAEVAVKHAGFIINRGGATAADIKKLVHIVQQEVYEKSGIKLETEPEFVGDFG